MELRIAWKIDRKSRWSSKDIVNRLDWEPWTVMPFQDTGVRFWVFASIGYHVLWGDVFIGQLVLLSSLIGVMTIFIG